MRNPSNTSLIAFTANLLGVTTAFHSPSAFVHRRVSKKSKPDTNNAIVPLTSEKSTTSRYFLDSSASNAVPVQDAVASSSQRRDGAVYKITEESSVSSFSLLKPYLEFNELDLQQLFHNDKCNTVTTSSSSTGTSLYDDFQEVETISHWKTNNGPVKTTASTDGTISCPLYFCQHKPHKTLPPWLSTIRPSEASSHLTSLRRDLSPHLSSKQISSVIDAVRTAAENDVQLAGSAEFCSLLVNSLEMVEVSALVGSVFHYCSLVSLRENELENHRTCDDKDENHSNDDSNTSWDEFDTKYLCALAGSGIESYSPHSMKIALDAARLKSIEALASRVVKISHVNSSNLRSLLLSINEEGDWRALAIRSGACLYRLRGLRRWREEGGGSGLGLVNQERSEEERRVGHEALHIYAPLGECC